MNKASERYNTKVEIPISVILETIFSDDNHDVKTLCRWAKHYEFVDLVKENGKDKLGYYRLQDDYTKQSFYIYLDKEERKQYDYEDFLLDKIEEKGKEIERLTAESTEWESKCYKYQDIINELEKWLEERKTYYCKGCSNIYEDSLGKTRLVNEDIFNEITKIKDKLNELKEGK